MLRRHIFGIFRFKNIAIGTVTFKTTNQSQNTKTKTKYKMTISSSSTSASASTSTNLAYFVGGAISSIILFYFLSPTKTNQSNNVKNNSNVDNDNDDSDSEDDEQILSVDETNNDRSQKWGIMDSPYKV